MNESYEYICVRTYSAKYSMIETDFSLQSQTQKWALQSSLTPIADTVMSFMLYLKRYFSILLLFFKFILYQNDVCPLV